MLKEPNDFQIGVSKDAFVEKIIKLKQFAFNF